MATAFRIPESLTVDLHYEKNNQIHNTLEMSKKRLIVRRGQPFQITIHFNDSKFNPNKSDYVLIAETGTKPSEKLGTRIVFFPSKSLNRKRWSAVVDSLSKTELTLSISPDPNSVIGPYSLFLQDSKELQSVSYQLGECVLLFNPWCSEDTVYLEKGDLCEEYVMNENGLIYFGDQYWIREMPWNFGQFHEGILDICFKLLENSLFCKENPFKDQSQRNDPVYISRVVSSMVNSIDDDGVIAGRWDGDYSSGVSPGKWVGSIKILRQWVQAGYKPVRYGQCWVFAAVACTVLRCFGIPTRVVTNFSSAHDTDGNLTIDTYYDENGSSRSNSADSVWNFHVWVECWMLRNDLDPGFDGWQVVDATPQEESKGIYCCGPSSVTAIKKGEVNLDYDCKFVYAEVNADKVTWMFIGNKKLKMYSNTDGIGKNISTKDPKGDNREDITHCYKYPEGSKEERTSFRIAGRRTADPYEGEKEFQLTIKTAPASNGSSVKVTLIISNKSSEKRVCRLLFAALKKTYNGEINKDYVKKYTKENIHVEPRKDETIALEISYNDYKDFPDSFNILKLSAFVIDLTKDTAFSEKEISLNNPSIQLKMLNIAVQSKPVYVEMSLENPLPVMLTNCVFTLEGEGLIDDEIQIKVDDLKPGVSTKTSGVFTPKKAGKRKLIVSFDSNELKNVKKSIDFKVSSEMN